jgi:hypothetical protein
MNPFQPPLLINLRNVVIKVLAIAELDIVYAEMGFPVLLVISEIVRETPQVNIVN